MSEATPKRLGVALGERLRELREKLGLPQDDVASWARRTGLRWTRTTVTAIETGRRDVALEEFLLLPYVLSHGEANSSGTLTLADLLPDEGLVALTPGFQMRAKALRSLVRGGTQGKAYQLPEEFGMLLKESRAEYGNVTERQMFEARRGAAGEAEQKVGRKLGVPAFVIALAAIRLWSRTLPTNAIGG